MRWWDTRVFQRKRCCDEHSTSPSTRRRRATSRRCEGQVILSFTIYIDGGDDDDDDAGVFDMRGREQKITPESKCPPCLVDFDGGRSEQSAHTPIATSREVGTRKRSRPNLITARRSVAGPQLDSRVLRAARDMSGEFSGREPSL
jgi:hypothetical protein